MEEARYKGIYDWLSCGPYSGCAKGKNLVAFEEGCILAPERKHSSMSGFTLRTIEKPHPSHAAVPRR